MFGKRGEAVAPYLTKGQLVGVSGEAALRPWKDKEGNEKQSLEVRVNDLTLLGKAETRDAAPGKPEAAEKPDKGGFEDFEDSPF